MLDEPAQQTENPRLSAETTKAVDNRERAIEAELATLKGHDWAGRYYQGDGLGVSLNLTLAPKAGAIFRWHGCLGLYDQGRGTVTERDGLLRIDWIIPGKGMAAAPPVELLVIRWDTRRYLVRPEEILEFCQRAVLDDNRDAGHLRTGLEEPRTGRHGFYYLRLGDESKPAKGKPVLPKGFEKYLAMKPIAAKIISTRPEKATLTKDWQDHDEFEQEVTISAGRADGVLPRMVFEVKEKQSPSASFAWITITKVNESTSEGMARYGREAGDRAPHLKMNWRVSTMQPTTLAGEIGDGSP
jgi:hypothetical protein